MNTAPNEFLKDLITSVSSYSLSDDEQKAVKFEGMEKYIFNKLNSSKFKASSIHEELASKIKEKIKTAVQKNMPVHISVPFGGYKKWQLPTYPYPDWSEIFYLVLLREYLSPICAGYKNGVLLEFFSDEIFVSRMNNYPQEDLDKYTKQFGEIVEWFKNYVPKNFQIKFSKIRDQISQEELMKRFDKEIATLKDKWNEVSKEEQEFRLRKSERNYKGDLSNLKPEQKQNILWESTLIHDAFIFGDWEKGVPWAFAEDMIPLGNRYTGKWGIHVKSSRSSTVQFWIGVGILEKRNNKIIPTTLTYEQFKKVKSEIKYENINLLTKRFINFDKIGIFSK